MEGIRTRTYLYSLDDRDATPDNGDGGALNECEVGDFGGLAFDFCPGVRETLGCSPSGRSRSTRRGIRQLHSAHWKT
jgi:hypothetical protein